MAPLFRSLLFLISVISLFCLLVVILKNGPSSRVVVVSNCAASAPALASTHWHRCRGGRAVAAACHGHGMSQGVLVHWQWQGERVAAGVPWRFGAAALQCPHSGVRRRYMVFYNMRS